MKGSMCSKYVFKVIHLCIQPQCATLGAFDIFQKGTVDIAVLIRVCGHCESVSKQFNLSYSLQYSVCVCEGVFFLTVGLLCFVLLWHDTCVNMSLMWSLLSLNPTEGHGQLRGQTVHRDPHTAGTPTGDREAWPFQRSLA